MKTTLLLIGSLVIIHCSSFAQGLYINFEQPDTSLTIDTTLSGNIWQIGSPHKVFFDSAYSGTKAIVTDTVNPYPVNNHSEFVVKYHSQNPLYWMYYEYNFSFWHKFDTDSMKDKCSIEISHNEGNNWTNVIDDSIINFIPHYFNTFYSQNIKGFSGNSEGWKLSSLLWSPCRGQIADTLIWFKFVFNSDSIQTNKEGWMIDDISLQQNICEGITSPTP